MSKAVDNRGIFGRIGHALVLVAALVSLGFIALRASPSRAKSQPYYVVTTLSDPLSIKPKLLFVLDTSGSMAWKAQSSSAACAWDECETAAGTVNESRLAAAKRTVQTVVQSTDAANFALMTFDRLGPRTSTGVPSTCADGKRFTWVSEYYAGTGGWAYVNRANGVTGTWRLCQGSEVRPYPYLRWDDLGQGSVITADDQSGVVPDSPLIDTSSGSITNAANATRKVQWFDEYLGERANLNSSTDADRSISRASSGDYGTSDAEVDAQVYGHDFYYWPYVEGFPGYSQFKVWPYDTGSDYGGVAGSSGSIVGATLYTPFYLDLSDSSIAAADWGPSSKDDANASVIAHTEPITRGGVDASSGTPWASAVGTIPATPPQSNAVGSHTTVASYLKFVTSSVVADACAPTAAILITDGQPSSGQGGSTLYGRLADLRTELGVKVYVVGFFLNNGDLNDMACAAAGACSGTCSSPCSDTPEADWDTCADPANSSTGCAFVSNNTDELAAAITAIVSRVVDVAAPSGPGSSIGDFGVGASGTPGKGAIVQTDISSYTEFPSWRGHVVRAVCDDLDAKGELLAECETPTPEFDDDDIEATFGPCVQGRDWDAGLCLQQTAWNERRIYTHSTSNELIPVANADGTASKEFEAELKVLGLLTSASPSDEADEYAAILLGRDAPDGWKLPGLANSAPIVVRRVPRYRAERYPEVAIRDPHCAGRPYSSSESGQLPESLYEFAKNAWSEKGQLESPSRHHEYQEAVLVGDDFGVLHAFQLNSGNELWGLVPRQLLSNLPEFADNLAAAMYQPSDIHEHIYGVAATPNVAIVYDDSSAKDADHAWRHLAVIGLGAGGSDFYALDVSHMSPYSSNGPVEILWTTESADASTYGRMLGETWARPAISYHVENDALGSVPDPLVVFASGYAEPEASDAVGRGLVVADALTGKIQNYALVPKPTAKTYEESFAVIADPAVASHCRSRFWAEAQESYFVDPGGEIFRWDLGRETEHAADSGGKWGTTATSALSEPFRACEGAGTTCTISSSAAGEPFMFAPAVSALDRIESAEDAASGSPAPATEQFLLALVSGSPDDDALPAEFHSSLYILVDDHSGEKKSGGFSVPSAVSRVPPGKHASFMRDVITDITRTRVFTPYEGASEIVETKTFKAETRPIRSPTIRVKGVVDEDGEVISDVEVYEIEFTVYEPPSPECDSRFYDPVTERYNTDPGSTFSIVYRLTASVDSGFDLINGAAKGGAEFERGYDLGLVQESVTQAGAPGCTDGLCGAQQGGSAGRPCDNNAGSDAGVEKSYAVPLASRRVIGFSPYE